MKMFMFLTFVLALCVFALSLISQPTPEPLGIPYHRISFEYDPKYLGSYEIEREHLGAKSPEWGEWTPREFFFSSQRGRAVCFGFFDRINGSATFRASDGYSWEEIKLDGRSCLTLIKTK